MNFTTSEMAATAFVIEALTLALVVITAVITARRMTEALTRIGNTLDIISGRLKVLTAGYDDNPAGSLVDIK